MRSELERSRADTASASRRLAAALSPDPYGDNALVDARADELSRTLDDAAYRLRLENRRGALAATRLEELEAEVARLRLRHAHDEARAEGAEAARAAAEEAARTAEAVNKQLRSDIASLRAGDHDVFRLRSDNSRLVALIESTTEYKELLADLSLGGRHYVNLAEVLSEQGVTSEHYKPIRDRAIDPATEAAAWVPREAVALAHAFLARLAPRGVPPAPFMQLLLELNGVWRGVTKGRLEAARKRHAADTAALLRRVQQRAPYRQVLAESELAHLKKLLRTGGGVTGRPLERMRLAAERTDSEESRLLLEWGMGTIERLSQQLNSLTEENLQLRRRLLGGDAEDEEGRTE